jgi:hypothetical protein
MKAVIPLAAWARASGGDRGATEAHGRNRRQAHVGTS